MTEPNRDFYKDKASKMFGIPYDEVTDEQRAEAKKLLMNYIYRWSDTSEEPFMLNASAIQKMIEQGNVTPLKDLHQRFISDCENNGYKITELQDEVTMENSGEPIAKPYSSPFDYKGMWLKHYQ